MKALDDFVAAMTQLDPNDAKVLYKNAWSLYSNITERAPGAAMDAGGAKADTASQHSGAQPEAVAWKPNDLIAVSKEFINSLRIGHNYCEDNWHSCPKAEEGCANDSEGTECNCGADTHNAKIDIMLAAAERR